MSMNAFTGSGVFHMPLCNAILLKPMFSKISIVSTLIPPIAVTGIELFLSAFSISDVLKFLPVYIIHGLAKNRA